MKEKYNHELKIIFENIRRRSRIIACPRDIKFIKTDNSVQSAISWIIPFSNYVPSLGVPADRRCCFFSTKQFPVAEQMVPFW